MPRSKTKDRTEPPPAAAQTTRSEQLINLMLGETGATAADLAGAVGWQIHSVRGFISGTLKKRADLAVITERVDGTTRYRVERREGAEQP